MTFLLFNTETAILICSSFGSKSMLWVSFLSLNISFTFSESISLFPPEYFTTCYLHKPIVVSCANCDKIFKKRADNKGFYRFSMEKCITSGEPAREALSSLTGANLTPVGSKRRGQFMCTIITFTQIFPEIFTRVDRSWPDLEPFCYFRFKPKQTEKICYQFFLVER